MSEGYIHGFSAEERDRLVSQARTLARYDIGLDVYSGTSQPDCFPRHAARCQDFLRRLHANGLLEKRSSRTEIFKAIFGNDTEAKALAEKVREGLKPYLKDATVSIQFLNHKVTLIGEVNNPKVISLPEGRISLLDVLALGGDMKEYGMRKNLLIIREADGKKIMKRVNLEDQSIFSSSWYWIMNNDVVYISVDDELKVREAKQTRTAATFSMFISAASLLIIIIDRILN